MSKFNFKPFDKVLVRDDDSGTWKIEFFERMEWDNKRHPYVCMWYKYRQCIPYNEETAHLLGTKEPYIPVEDEATKYTPGEIVEIWHSGDTWGDAIYLDFEESFFSVGNAHKVYDKKLGICTQPPNEIRKKEKQGLLREEGKPND